MTPPLLSRIARTAAVLVATAATALTLTGGAHADPTASAVAFKAEHTDRCLSSYTTGELTTPTVVPTAVKVVGEVALRNPSVCLLPSRPVAVAVFTAYSGRTVVDAERQTTTGASKFEFVLAATLTPTPLPIDQVTVQVCHTATTPTPTPIPLTCGEISSYPL
ncbi:MAG: hypothetical protein HOV94_24025 [Saccharothrix sp.]|nr:hypothetical protein [Saccharothrix sp.]